MMFTCTLGAYDLDMFLFLEWVQLSTEIEKNISISINFS